MFDGDGRTRPWRRIGRKIGLTLVAVTMTLVAGSGAVPSAADDTGGRRTYEDTIDGAKYRVEMPDHWNGTLVLFSHGYYIEQFMPEEIELAGQPRTVEWLLDHGYALAASEFKNPLGYAVEDGYRDQLALLDWFETNVGQPEVTLTHGLSQGAVISALLAERNPDRFDGVLTTCGEYDTLGTWNMALDIGFVVRTLIAEDDSIDLVRPDGLADATAAAGALSAAIQEAKKTDVGRARLALAGAVGNIPAWSDTFGERPTDLAGQLAQQALWVEYAYILGIGPLGRLDLEERTGGNPSSNTGINYWLQFAQSSQKQLVWQAYRETDLSLFRDLAQLNRAPRIEADDDAVGYMREHGVATGRLSVPTLTMHNTGDGGAVPDQERWYARQVRREGEPRLLRQVYVDRGAHCAFSAAEEIAAIRTVEMRARGDHWPGTSPGQMTARASGLDERYQVLWDFTTGETKTAPLAFTPFQPPRFLRPSS